MRGNKLSFTCNLTAEEYVHTAIAHIDSTNDFIKKASNLLLHKPYEITTGCTEFGRLIKKRANAVLREVRLLASFMRMKPYPEMLLVGKCEIEHHTGQLIAYSLSRRFDMFVVLVFVEDNFYLATERKDISKFPDLEFTNESEVVRNIREFLGNCFEERLAPDLVREDGDLLWEKYYETQFLEQRINVKQFRRFIPKYVMKKANMKVESEFYKKAVANSKNNKILEDFLDLNSESEN